MKKIVLCVMMGIAGWVSASEVPAFRIGGLTFDFVTNWTISPQKRPMSAATMVFKKDGKAVGPNADFYYFGAGQGGGVQANLERWKKQFQGSPTVKEEVRKVNDRAWHFIRIDGTFLKGRPFGPKTAVADQRTLGAIVEDAGGTVFVKLVDAKGTVSDDVEKAFVKLVESAL